MNHLKFSWLSLFTLRPNAAMLWALNMFRMFGAICSIFQNFKRTPWNGDFCSLDTYHESLYPLRWVSPEEGWICSGVGAWECTYHVAYPMMHVMYLPRPPQQRGRHLWKYNLPATSLAGGKNLINFQFVCDDITNSTWKFCRTDTRLHICLMERPSVFTIEPKVLHLSYCSGMRVKSATVSMNSKWWIRNFWFWLCVE